MTRTRSTTGRLLAAGLATRLLLTAGAAQEPGKQGNGKPAGKNDQQAAGQGGGKVTDQDMAGAVERRLRRNKGVSADTLDVTANAGVVTLTGTADSLAVKDRAAEVARATKGVRAVVNRVTVRPPAGLSDDLVRSRVVAALAADSAADSYEITTAVSGGVVTLSGTVQSWVERDLAERVARRVRGATEVRNDLTVRTPAQPRPDAEIVADVRGRMEWDRRVNAGGIDVQVKDGKVTLSGTVASAAERTQAVADAWVTGVTGVAADGLTVSPDLEKGKPAAGASGRTDAAVRQAVVDALMYDPRVLSFNPTVTVRNGVVTLTGVVDSPAAKRAAEADARNTAGVWGVLNYLKVRPATTRTDADLIRDVRAALDREPSVDRPQITVTAYNGRVYLSGTVDSYGERFAAESAAGRVNGVTDVRNYLAVDYTPPTFGWYPLYSTRDIEIRDEIEDEMFWSPFVDSTKVTVVVKDGVTTLTGAVEDWSESQAATENAIEGGATRVVNNLTVRYGPDYSRSK